MADLLGGLGSALDDLAPWLARVDGFTGEAAEAGVVRLVRSWTEKLLWNQDDWFTWWSPNEPRRCCTRWTSG